MMVFKICVHVNYEDAKKEFFKQYPDLNNDINIGNLDQYLHEGIQYKNDGFSVKINLNPSIYHSDLSKMFITWLKSKNILLNKEKEIYLDA